MPSLSPTCLRPIYYMIFGVKFDVGYFSRRVVRVGENNTSIMISTMQDTIIEKEKEKSPYLVTSIPFVG